jgi:hypothetical protein
MGGTQLTIEFPRILDRVAAEIVIEIRPQASRIVLANSLRPNRQFFAQIIMAIPPVHAVEPYVDFIARLDKWCLSDVSFS